MVLLLWSAFSSLLACGHLVAHLMGDRKERIATTFLKYIDEVEKRGKTDNTELFTLSLKNHKQSLQDEKLTPRSVVPFHVDTTYTAIRYYMECVYVCY